MRALLDRIDMAMHGWGWPLAARRVAWVYLFFVAMAAFVELVPPLLRLLATFAVTAGPVLIIIGVLCRRNARSQDG